MLNVYRSNAQSGTYTKVGEYAETSPVALNNEPVGVNWYKVSLTNAAGEGAMSDPLQQIVLGKPTTPTGSESGGNVIINTPRPANATGIIVEQGNGTTWKQIYSGANTSVTLANLNDGKNFRTAGTAQGAQSAWSEIFVFALPKKPAIGSTAASAQTVNIAWS